MSVKGSSPFISTIVVSYGATVARLILDQKIVVRTHVGKRLDRKRRLVFLKLIIVPELAVAGRGEVYTIIKKFLYL